ncbi:MAG: IclR family transcriptional regulator [Thermoflexales bacterium]|nr:IclR family transcriptional regulator [Thermoflexales bacterium]
MEDNPAVKTVNRLVEVLDSFSSRRSGWSLTELSEHLDIPKSTLHRFLLALEAHGILQRDPKDRRWRLGYRPLLWGRLAANHSGLQVVARPVMESLAAETGETVLLTVYQNGEVVCIEKVDSPHAIRLAMDVGTRRPPHAGASSKVLMAYLPPDEIEALLQRGLPRLCTNTITDPQALREELARIREQGYAFSMEETDLGAWGVATPIWSPQGEVIAAIGLAGPTFRMSEESVQQYVRLCRQAAEQISRFLIFAHS